MEIHELVVEMKLLERRLTLYEEKYGVLSEDFYTALLRVWLGEDPAQGNLKEALLGKPQ